MMQAPQEARKIIPLLKCPITDIAISRPCPNLGCMYFSRTSSTNCRYSALTRLQEEKTKNECYELVQHAFSLEGIDLDKAMSRVRLVIICSKYFTYLLEKEISDARLSDFELAMDSQDSYEKWSFNPKPSFNTIRNTMKYLKNNMK